MSVCMYVCPGNRETPTSGCRGDLWSTTVFLILACDDIIFKKKMGSAFFPRLLKRAVLDQPTVDSVGFSRGRFVAAAVGC